MIKNKLGKDLVNDKANFFRQSFFLKKSIITFPFD